MTYLIVLSFILHFISFFIIILLYQRLGIQQPLDKEKTLREMEELLVSYTTEMKENNERLVRIIKRETKNIPEVKSDKNLLKKEKAEDVTNAQESESFVHHSDVMIHYEIEDTLQEEESYNSYTPLVPDNDEAKIDTSPTSNVLSLYQQGYTDKEIAKKLNIGVGEVELLLEFYK